MKHYVGVDIGGTRLKAGLVNDNHQVVREAVAWLEPGDKTEEGLIARVAALVNQVREGVRPVLVGIGVAGVIDRRSGVVARSPNFPTWRNFAVQRRLQDLTGFAVLVDNDANCVIAGEALMGARAGRDLIGLTLGTGVGGGLVLNGQVWRGANGMGGELGHIVADPAGPLCGCGGRGCLEMYPSVNGLRHQARLREVAVDLEAPNLPELLANLARGGDATAQACFDAAGVALGRVLGGLLNVFDIKTVLLAGGVSGTWDRMEAATWAAIRGASFPEIADGVEIYVGTLGERAGIYGAALQWKLQPHD